MIVGERMLRVADGQKGVVVQNGPELRIMYLDRGSERLALKSEKWVPDELKPGPLRPEEVYLVALHADRVLQALETNSPFKWWEKPALTDAPYDKGLIEAIQAYLMSRETRPAG